MKNSSLIILILFITCQNISSQNTTLIDSLKSELVKRKENDSIKVMILTKLHEKLMFSKPEEAKMYAHMELDISKK